MRYALCVMRIIVGLGNPGKKYELTRHNAGFMAVDAIAKKYNSTWQFNKKFNAEICHVGTVGTFVGTRHCLVPTNVPTDDNKIILIKPQTFMNNSGQAVQAILSYYKLLPKKLGVIKIKDSDLSNVLTIIHDDLDIELSKYKISTDSRSAGHNGVQSIINHLKTKNFKRIRIGIKTEMASKMLVEKFVLQKFGEEEIKIINNLILEIVDESKNIH